MSDYGDYTDDELDPDLSYPGWADPSPLFRDWSEAETLTQKILDAAKKVVELLGDEPIIDIFESEMLCDGYLTISGHKNEWTEVPVLAWLEISLITEAETGGVSIPQLESYLDELLETIALEDAQKT